MHTELSAAHAPSSAAQRRRPSSAAACIADFVSRPARPISSSAMSSTAPAAASISSSRCSRAQAQARSRSRIWIAASPVAPARRPARPACKYGKLVDIGRQMLESAPIRSPGERLMRSALGAALSRRTVFAAALRVGQWLRPLLPAAQANAYPRACVPGRRAGGAPRAPHDSAAGLRAAGACAEHQCRSRARVRPPGGVAPHCQRGDLLRRVESPSGRTERALRRRAATSMPGCASRRRRRGHHLSASGCGVMVKDYGELLRHDPRYAARAERVSAATRDLCEVLACPMSRPLSAQTLRASQSARRLAIALHAAAWTETHGARRAAAQGRRISLTPVRDPHLCCGSAGTYSILQRDLAVRLRSAKLSTLQEGAPAVIATANIGCLQHLGAAAEVPVKHWIELIDEASAP
jgi:glycolate oxidase iron-sulfur subunit